MCVCNIYVGLCVCLLGLTKRHTRDRSDESPAHTLRIRAGARAKVLTGWFWQIEFRRLTGSFYLYPPCEGVVTRESRKSMTPTCVHGSVYARRRRRWYICTYTSTAHIYIFGIICVAESRPMCSTRNARAQYCAVYKIFDIVFAAPTC